MDYRVFLSLSLCFLSLFPDLSYSDIQFPGRLGDKKTQGSVIRMTTGASSALVDSSRATQLSWHPRAFIYRGFLTDEECDHLINLAKDKLEKSMVADNESGKSIMSEVRTSSGMFLGRAQDEVVAGIEARIAAWTFLPAENGEPIQILHYEHGEKYEPHFDYFHDKVNQEMGGHRVATVLMYLSSVERGGETIFPNSEATETQSKDDNSSDCAKNGYSVKPYKGDALLFFSLHPDATTDSLSLHGSCPVIEGEKWSATKWIHVRSFEKPVKQANSDCVDLDVNCPRWAAAGLNRCGKSCRLRWTNYLRPDLKHDNFTPQEEQLILEYHKAIGSRWSLIAKQLPGRTDNDVKNYWNTKLRKKLSKMGIDPLTHKPISQILSEYGNISGGHKNGFFNNSINNTSMSQPEPSLVSSMPMIEQVFANNNYSWDNVAKFQVMNQETIQPNFLNEISSSASSSSSSSCSVTQLSSPQPSQFQMTPSSPSSWSQYLLADPFLSTDMDQRRERDFQEMLSSVSSVILQNETSREMFAGGQTKHWSEAASSSADSFVEAILDKHSEMQMEFPELLDDYLSY